MACGIALLAFLVHARGLANDFIAGYDDDQYVLNNQDVQSGLSARGLHYALTGSCGANWHPLTVLSHELDCTVFHLWPAGHHLTSLMLHCANAALVFILFSTMTGERWRSAMVASLFAVHPVHVESVAFVSQRKDVLSGFFFLLTLWLYARYTVDRDRKTYVAVCVCAALALLAKPIAVTVPFILLLLDVWPLSRARPFRPDGISVPRLVIEKAPIFVLAFTASVVTFLVQRASGAVAPLEAHPMAHRAANAVIAYVRYLGKAFLPVELSPFYSYLTAFPFWQWGGALAVLVAISACCVVVARKAPYLLVGWLWFMGMLVPMIGLIQVGEQSMADRYAYVTFIGLYIIVVWGLGDALRGRVKQGHMALASSIVLALLSMGTVIQTGYWRDPETLWTRALALDANNPKAHSYVGIYEAIRGNRESALHHHEEAARISPNKLNFTNLGATQFRFGLIDESMRSFERATELAPGDAIAQYRLGVVYALKKRPEDAEKSFEAVRGKNGDFYAQSGSMMLQYGYPELALKRFEKAKEMGGAPPNIDALIERAKSQIKQPREKP